MHTNTTFNLVFHVFITGYLPTRNKVIIDVEMKQIKVHMLYVSFPKRLLEKTLNVLTLNLDSTTYKYQVFHRNEQTYFAVVVISYCGQLANG